MKKTGIVILMVCYLAASSGIIVNFHYCMNKLASTELFGSQVKKCGKCGMNIHKSKGCCHDEVQVVKLEDDQKVTAGISFTLTPPDELVHIPSEFISTSFINCAPEQRHYYNHSPPLLTGQDIYLENNVFRI